MMRILIAGLAVVTSAAAIQAEELELSGVWHFECRDNPSVCGPVEVPGDIQSALLKLGRMPDPFWGRNEVKVQDWGRKEWVVSRTFDVGDAILSKKAIVLRLDNVDTFATISINGHVLGKTDNRFRRWEFDVKPYLKKGANKISGLFASAELRGNELEKEYGRHFYMCNVKWALNQALVRKPACHAGWDWGLALMVTGFCGETKILAYDDCKIDYVYSSQDFNADMTHCDLTVFADATDADGRAFTVTNRFSIEKPPLWWPNGAGKRAFYTYKIKVGSHEITRRIGLRKVEVLNTPDTDANGKPGARMAFKVNGREIFMKGANWIPCSALESEQTPERYRNLLESAAAANMNMVRVWGGGQFEKDCFYEMCDELGILLWHDFMFSCALYPGDNRFLGTVREELRHQIRRLRDHASIALWCGDNECIGALKWWKDALKDYDYFKGELVKRHALLAACVRECDPERSFWPSSPCGGPNDFSDAWHNDNKGDMHNWMVWQENASFEKYYEYRPRFCSEFGYQSFPSREVAETFCRDVNPTAPDFEWHQKNIGGNQRILETMARYFRFPQGTDSILYLSQVQQAIAIKTAVEGWRAQRPRCMGALYWQLNDNWPVSSWSSIEYGGKWKHLHYQARRFYAPLAVVAVPDDADGRVKTVMVRVKVLNDLAEAVDAEVSAEFFAFDGRLLKTVTQRLTAEPNSVADWGGGTLKKDDVSEPAFLVLTLKSAHGVSRNEWFFGYFKEFDLSEASVEAGVEGFKVSLKTDRPAFFVWVNAKGVPGEFSDNSFTLMPGRPVTLEFCPRTKVSADSFRKAVSVHHLRQTY